MACAHPYGFNYFVSVYACGMRAPNAFSLRASVCGFYAVSNAVNTHTHTHDTQTHLADYVLYRF